jgi:hypothetical protein
VELDLEKRRLVCHLGRKHVKMYLKLSTNCISKKNNNEIHKNDFDTNIIMSKTALTGATSGIGKATAEILAKTIIKLSFAVVKTEWLNLKRTFKTAEVHTLLFCA